MFLRKVKPDEKELKSALLDDLQKTLTKWSTQQTKDQVGKMRATDATPSEAAEPGADVVDGIAVESVKDLADAGDKMPVDGPEGSSGNAVGEGDSAVPGLGEASKVTDSDKDENTESGTDVEDEKRSLEDIIRGIGRKK